MEPIQEITKEEFFKLVDEMKNEGKALSQEAIKKGWKSIHQNQYTLSLYFYNSRSNIPCLYRPRGRGIGSKGYNPLTGREVECKPVPVGYKLHKKNIRSTIHHLTLDGCPKIVPFETVVRCAFSTLINKSKKFFTCEHLVGDCPAKE